METVEDIIREKRLRADEIERDVAEKMKSGEMISDRYARELVADIRREAVRLEAAYKREHALPDITKQLDCFPPEPRRNWTSTRQQTRRRTPGASTKRRTWAPTTATAARSSAAMTAHATASALSDGSTPSQRKEARMADTHDTIKGLLAEFRGYAAGMPDSYHVTMSWADFRKMLTRFEWAHDHDIATATEACARAVVGACVKQQEADRKCVALREALKQVNKLNDLWFDTFTLRDGATSIHDEIENVISVALAATEKEGGAR